MSTPYYAPLDLQQHDEYVRYIIQEAAARLFTWFWLNVLECLIGLSMVDIYLKLVDDSDTFIHFLSIPLSDIRRLSVCPLKWIRFVVFTICGSHGHLHETAAVNVPPVDYGILDLVESSTYYYIPDRESSFHSLLWHEIS